MYKILFLVLFILFNFHQSFSQDLTFQIVPTEILLKKTNQYNYSISPNGKYFAEVIENNIENDIVIIDIDNYKLFKRIPLKNSSVQGLYWLTSNRLIYESLGEIIAIDIDGNNSSIIASRIGDKVITNFNKLYKNFRFNNILNLLPDNKNEILIETYDYNFYATLKRVNVFTGQKYVVINGSKHKINKWITDKTGKVKLGIRIKDKEFIYVEYSEETEKWEPFYVEINNTKYPLSISGKSYFKQNISFEDFGYEPDVMYITSNINSNRRTLLKYDMKQKKVIETLVKDTNCDVSDPMGEGIALIFDQKKKELVGARYQGIIPTYRWFSKDFNKKYQLIYKKNSKFINEVIDVDNNNESFLIYQWSDIKKGNIGVFNFKDSTYAVLVNLNEKLNEYELSKTKNVVISTRDNYKLSGYLNLPVNYSKDSLMPLVIIPHGGPWSRDYWELNDFSQYFATRGYATLRINYRGSTGFGKTHVLAGVSSIDKIMIDDIADGTKYVMNKYSIDKNKVFIFGHSYGGYATYMSLLKYPDLYSAGVALSAPTDLKSWIKKLKKDKSYFAYEFWKTALGTNDSRYLEKISPINYVEKFDRPLLVFHGKYDETIPVEQAEKMVEKLKDNNKEVKLEILQNEGHSIWDSNSLGYILDSANDFFMNKKE